MIVKHEYLSTPALAVLSFVFVSMLDQPFRYEIRNFYCKPWTKLVEINAWISFINDHCSVPITSSTIHTSDSHTVNVHRTINRQSE